MKVIKSNNVFIATHKKFAAIGKTRHEATKNLSFMIWSAK